MSQQKTRGQIIDALYHCADESTHTCDKCPYNDGRSDNCSTALLNDAREIIASDCASADTDRIEAVALKAITMAIEHGGYMITISQICGVSIVPYVIEEEEDEPCHKDQVSH